MEERGGEGKVQLLRIQGFPGQRLMPRQRLRQLRRGGVGRFRWVLLVYVEDVNVGKGVPCPGHADWHCRA